MLVEVSLECLRSKKAEEIVVMNLGKVSDIADYFIVCTGGSDLHVRAIADAVVEGIEKHGQRVWHVEGYETGRWVLIDLVDVVVHIFLETTRQFYGLERLWGDAIVEVEREDTKAPNSIGENRVNTL
jgi:ribosome-associated protein